MQSSAAVSKDLTLATSFKERLDELGCPYTEGVEESWILELIFRPGEPRIRLLQWLFAKFDSKLNDLLDPQYAALDSRLDSRIQRLLFVASTLGLCRTDDAELIRGTASVAKQTSFMDLLLDLVCIRDASDDPQERHMFVHGTVSKSLDLDSQFLKDCEYIDVLANSESQNNLFPTQIKLLPPDIAKQIEQSRKEKGLTEKDKWHAPDIKRLTENADTLAKDLERQNDMLREIMKEHDYQEADPMASAKVGKTLRLVLSELSQLVTGFSYCFENEMRPWCNKPPPSFNQLGPAFKRVHTMLQQFSMLLEGLSVVRKSHKELSSTATNKLKSLSLPDQQYGFHVSVGQAALQSFQECIDVLEESTNRRDGNSLNSTLNISAVKME